MKNQNNLFEKAKAFYFQNAELIADSEEKLKELLANVYLKLNQLADSPKIREISLKIGVLFRMIKSHLNHEYSGLSKRALILMVLGLLYFILPVDFVPDFIPGIGYLDDLTVIVGVYKSLSIEIEKFMLWEKSRI